MRNIARHCGSSSNRAGRRFGSDRLRVTARHLRAVDSGRVGCGSSPDQCGPSDIGRVEVRVIARPLRAIDLGRDAVQAAGLRWGPHWLQPRSGGLPRACIRVGGAATSGAPTILMTKLSGGTGGTFLKKVRKTLKPLRITVPTLVD